MVQRLLRAPIRFDDNDMLVRGPIVSYKTPYHSRVARQRAEELHRKILRRRDKTIRARASGSTVKITDVTITVDDLTELILCNMTTNCDVIDATVSRGRGRTSRRIASIRDLDTRRVMCACSWLGSISSVGSMRVTFH